MPQISYFYGIVIAMYWDDHPPPHFHATYGDSSAVVDLRTGTVIEGYLPPRAARLVKRWTQLHVEELRDDWNRARASTPLVPIDPLP